MLTHGRRVKFNSKLMEPSLVRAETAETKIANFSTLFGFIFWPNLMSVGFPVTKEPIAMIIKAVAR